MNASHSAQATGGTGARRRALVKPVRGAARPTFPLRKAHAALLCAVRLLRDAAREKNGAGCAVGAKKTEGKTPDDAGTFAFLEAQIAAGTTAYGVRCVLALLHVRKTARLGASGRAASETTQVTLVMCRPAVPAPFSTDALVSITTLR